MKTMNEQTEMNIIGRINYINLYRCPNFSLVEKSPIVLASFSLISTIVFPTNISYLICCVLLSIYLAILTLSSINRKDRVVVRISSDEYESMCKSELFRVRVNNSDNILDFNSKTSLYNWELGFPEKICMKSVWSILYLGCYKDKAATNANINSSTLLTKEWEESLKMIPNRRGRAIEATKYIFYAFEMAIKYGAIGRTIKSYLRSNSPCSCGNRNCDRK